ncbi:protein PAM68, chloroplastic isoform X1 [Vigna umbellata]|uniref:protein PAM68, chloroplastic isoform X1 n=1 Tax=Vigna umbellata TaxID=87088 RepID=UPI001F5E73EC|nr:protein PAM68, chloroplastic isoform X1 [Vigna umbellata]
MVATAATFFNSQFLHTHGRINIWRLNRNSNFSENVKFEFPIHRSEFHHQVHLPHLAPICATFKGPKGFGPSSQKKKKKSKKIKREYVEDEDEDDDDDEEEEPDRGVIPEIVTNRMMNRMAVSVGIPLGIGLLFFPFFYYLKVGLKIDVPTWVPFIVSFFFFGSALLGVSYGIVSSSWDPLREGSFWGWNEAQKNWPVFWQSLRGGSRKN